MKHRYLFPLLLLLCAVLSACASTPLAPGCWRIGHDGQFCPLAPAQLPVLSAMHIVSIRHDGSENTFMGELQIDSQALRLAGFSLFGTSLFTLAYDGRRVTQQPAQPALHAQLLVAMLELTLADPAALQGRLHNLSLKISHHGDTEVRELSEAGHLIAHVEKSAGALAESRINIEIPPAKLTVQMTPLANGKATP